MYRFHPFNSPFPCLLFFLNERSYYGEKGQHQVDFEGKKQFHEHQWDRGNSDTKNYWQITDRLHDSLYCLLWWSGFYQAACVAMLW